MTPIIIELGFRGIHVTRIVSDTMADVVCWHCGDGWERVAA